jgi:DNA-directed RNA polymerase specialized sigma24 family protein
MREVYVAERCAQGSAVHVSKRTRRRCALRSERGTLQRELDAELRREQDRFAEIVMAKRDLGMHLPEIADTMDCSVGTVSRAIARWH